MYFCRHALKYLPCGAATKNKQKTKKTIRNWGKGWGESSSLFPVSSNKYKYQWFYVLDDDDVYRICTYGGKL